MPLNLKMHPQTALLLTVDSLMSTDGAYKVELFIEAQSIAGAVFKLNADLTADECLVVGNDLPELLQHLMQYLQKAEQPSEPAVRAEGSHEAQGESVSAAVPDSTGV